MCNDTAKSVGMITDKHILSEDSPLDVIVDLEVDVLNGTLQLELDREMRW